MPELQSPHVLLRLLAKSLDADLLLLGHDDGERLRVDETYPGRGLAGHDMRVPPGLINAVPTVLDTRSIRLPLQWIEACGARPSWLGAAPLATRGLHLVAACSRTAPEAVELADAASVITQVLRSGGGTQRERDVSRRIAALVNNLPAPLIFVDSGTVEVFLNDRARELLGFTPNEQVRQIAVAERLAALVHGTGKRPSGDAELSLGIGEPSGFEIEHRGETYKVQTQRIEQHELTGRVWLFTDVTREKSFHVELRELTGLLQLTVENVSEGVALVSADLRMMLWNESFIELLSYPREAVYQGADFLALARLTAERGELGGEGVEVALKRLRESLRSYQARQQELRRDDGRVLDVTRKSLPGGRFILTVRDITDEDRAARLKDELVSTVSHELRTPLTSISGALALVKSGMAGELPDSARRLLEIAHRNSERLTRLVNDLLDLDKLELGQTAFSFKATDLRTLLSEAVMQSEAYAQRFGVALKPEIVDKPVVVNADADRLMQVMSNLISNAAKFSPEGSDVTLRLCVVQDDQARISVIDRGRGISPAFRQRLFGRFAQEAAPSERGQPGTGLGLAISKEIVERHGGTIDLDPHTDIGATFHIMLPLLKGHIVADSTG
ncbi:sensor histidine kinase [Sphingomonas xinjiangensis]|uniref:histidine kinase n=1 Tax=Sphingomonas xinjiangensis TaxID=643568 RepID=A0A840YDW2_9SPHN|nr:PAS domain-containing sensor histidine kinase [Sphingomonas xinjiangensis]MBB5711034.1 signal transduction histidine kinase [Sphingomonas xinjiangensis]